MKTYTEFYDYYWIFVFYDFTVKQMIKEKQRTTTNLQEKTIRKFKYNKTLIGLPFNYYLLCLDKKKKLSFILCV